MIAVVDSGVANLASVVAAFHRLDAGVEVTADPRVIRRAGRVVIPGVGSAAAAMSRFRALGLVDVLRGLSQPVLGICLGMQLLFAHSDESGGTEGLGIISGAVRRLEPSPTVRIPHMGWNDLQVLDAQHPLLRGVSTGSFMYFVHSYALSVGNYTLASCRHGADFSAVVGHRNFLGCQFHPERSGEAGARVLKNFLTV